MNDLEARNEWLESIIRENLPSIDLATRPAHQFHVSKDLNRSSSQHDKVDRDDEAQPDDPSLREITDQVRLFSVSTGSEPRYLGPSSGMFFTRFVLRGLGQRIDVENSFPRGSIGDFPVPADLLVVKPQEMPLDQAHTQWLLQVYFDNINSQFPFLHKPTLLQTVRKFYDGAELRQLEEFQIFMVLAIAATIASRRAKVPLSAEGYFASAMSQLDSVFDRPSISEIQCVLLLQMYTMHSPSSGLRLWYLHYHALASVMELGLQRNIPGNRFSILETEMRTRVFWCAYAIDRQLSSLMGRPVGFMDEQCDLRVSHVFRQRYRRY